MQNLSLAQLSLSLLSYLDDACSLMYDLNIATTYHSLVISLVWALQISRHFPGRAHTKGIGVNKQGLSSATLSRGYNHFS